MEPQPMTNWMGNVVLQQDSVAAPSTIAQLQQTVRAALPPLRVIGSGHSFTPLCHCDGGGTLVSLRNLRRVRDLRPGSDGAASVVCEGGSSPSHRPSTLPPALFLSHAAGATFTDVIRHLNGSRFALPNLPSLPHVTVAGAIATGTHGSGIQPGMEAMITSFVLDITFVTHDGRCESASAALPTARVAAHALRPQPRHVLPRR
jgi:xylitol oxidase